MAILAPPSKPPLVAHADDNNGDSRVRLHLQIVGLSTVTILAMAWLMTLGTVPGILGMVVAKHVLVAILVMGLGVDDKDQPEA